MPSYEEIASDMHKNLGIGMKTYETTAKRKKTRKDKVVNIIVVVDNRNEIEKSRKAIKNQTYENIKIIYVVEDEKLLDFVENNENYVKGCCFFDAVEYFRNNAPPVCEHYYTEYITSNFWQPGHLESLVDSVDDGIPVASMMQLHELAGWDGLKPPDYEFIPAECILWSHQNLSAWQYDNGFNAVDNLLKHNPMLVLTRKPTVVIPAD